MKLDLVLLKLYVVEIFCGYVKQKLIAIKLNERHHWCHQPLHCHGNLERIRAQTLSSQQTR